MRSCLKAQGALVSGCRRAMITWLSQSLGCHVTVLKHSQSSMAGARQSFSLCCAVGVCSKCACRLTAALHKIVGNRSSIGWRRCRSGIDWVAAVDAACNRCGCRLHDTGGQSRALASVGAVPAKACLETRWNSELISPPVPSCSRPPNSHPLPVSLKCCSKPSSPTPDPPTCASTPARCSIVSGATPQYTSPTWN